MCACAPSLNFLLKTLAFTITTTQTVPYSSCCIFCIKQYFVGHLLDWGIARGTNKKYLYSVNHSMSNLEKQRATHPRGKLTANHFNMLTLH